MAKHVKKKCPECRKGTPLWMVSWADMVTLLMCFFVIIVAFSSAEKAKFKEMAGSMKMAFGITKDMSLSPLISGPNIVSQQFQQEVMLVNVRERVRLTMNRQIDNGDAVIEEEEGGFVIRFDGTSLFNEKTGELHREAVDLLKQVSVPLAAQPNIVHIRAYWDNSPAPGESSRQISANMAVAVTELLTKQGEIDPRRLVAMAMGASEPIQLDINSPNKIGERRVEILFTRMTPGYTKEQSR